MLLLSHFNLTPEELQRFYALNLEEGYYNEAVKTREIVAINQYRGTTECEKLFPNEDKISSFACVPLKHAHKVFGIMCIYDSEPERFAFEEVQFLSSLKDSLGLMVEQSLLTQKFRARKRSLQTADLLTRIFLETKDLEEDFPSLAQNLRKVQDFDYISLSLVEGAGKNVRKLSLGLEENLLLDKNVNLPVYGTSIGWAIDSGEPMIENDVPAKGYYEDTAPEDKRESHRYIEPGQQKDPYLQRELDQEIEPVLLAFLLLPAEEETKRIPEAGKRIFPDFLYTPVGISKEQGHPGIS
jgi:hypothetical protein